MENFQEHEYHYPLNQSYHFDPKQEKKENVIIVK